MKKFIVAAAIAASMGAGLGLAPTADAAPAFRASGPHLHIAVFRGPHLRVIPVVRPHSSVNKRSVVVLPSKPRRVSIVNRPR